MTGHWPKALEGVKVDLRHPSLRPDNALHDLGAVSGLMDGLAEPTLLTDVTVEVVGCVGIFAGRL